MRTSNRWVGAMVAVSVDPEPSPGYDAELLAQVVRVYRTRLDHEERWRRDALCAEPGYGTAMFFPVVTGSTS